VSLSNQLFVPTKLWAATTLTQLSKPPLLLFVPTKLWAATTHGKN